MNFFLQIWIFSNIWEPTLTATHILPSLAIITIVSFQVSTGEFVVIFKFRTTASTVAWNSPNMKYL